jgi:single-strand DNA-binding protein
VLKIRLATTEQYLDRNRVKQERTDWHSVIVWGRRAEALVSIIHKGSMIYIEGSLRTSSYDGKDGEKRYKTEVVATNIVLCGGRNGGQQATPAATGRADDDYNPDDAAPGGDDFPF